MDTYKKQKMETGPRIVVEPYTHEESKQMWGIESDFGCDSTYLFMVSFVDDNGLPVPESGLYGIGSAEDVPNSFDSRGYIYYSISSKNKVEVEEYINKHGEDNFCKTVMELGLKNIKTKPIWVSKWQ